MISPRLYICTPPTCVITIAGHWHRGPSTACIVFLASGISVRYRSIPVPDLDPYFTTGLVVLVSAFLFIPAPDWPDAGQSGIRTFKKLLWRWKGRQPVRPIWLLLVLYSILDTWCWNVKTKCRNAGEKLVRHRYFYRKSVRHGHSSICLISLFTN